MGIPLNQYHRWPLREKLLLPETIWQLIRAQRVVKRTTFGQLQERLGQEPMVAKAHTDAAACAKQVGRVVRSAARHLPWECACLAQALAARAMLRRRGIVTTLHIGVSKDGETHDFRSHAWLSYQQWVLTGREGHSSFKEMITL